MSTLYIRDIDFGPDASEAAFHDAFQMLFGFPPTYERTMAAWVDHMSRLGEPGVSNWPLRPGDLILLRVPSPPASGPEAAMRLRELQDGAAQVNGRVLNQSSGPILAVAVG